MEGRVLPKKVTIVSESCLLAWYYLSSQLHWVELVDKANGMGPKKLARTNLEVFFLFGGGGGIMSHGPARFVMASTR